MKHPHTRHSTRYNAAGLRSRTGRFTLIALLTALPALLFAWSAGWLSSRLSPQQFVDQLEQNGGRHPGFRRNHAKGLCVSGYFEPSADARRLSTAGVFADGRHAVNGRLSIPGGNPYGADDKAPLRSLGLQIDGGRAHEWRMALNSSTVFVVARPEDFYALLQAQQPDPVSGRRDKEKLRAFFNRHPETAAFRQWQSQHTPSDSFANTRYNSLNSFVFTDNTGTERYLRWSLIPQQTYQPQAADSGADFLAADFLRRVMQQPQRWTLQLQLAADGDPVNDATRAWPAERPTVNAGTLVINAAGPQQQGACRDINFDPLILPAGIRPSGDPLLAARSAVYSDSFTRRITEQATQDYSHD